MEGNKLGAHAARIVLDTSMQRHPVDRKILGHFIEHLGRCIENGIWMYQKTGRPLFEKAPLERVPLDLLDAIKALRVPVLRWPGGCFSDGYHWRDGVGPRDGRHARKNLAWGGIKNILYNLGPRERNHFGTGEFLALCDELDCNAYINVNYGSGTPEEAAAWVAHARARSKRAVFWGIANEIYAIWEKGWEKHPESYANRYLAFARAMKAVDPAIKLVAVGWNGRSIWNRALLERIKGQVDYLSIHLYFGNKPSIGFFLSKKPPPATEAHYYTEVNSASAYEKLIEQTIADIDAVYGKDNPARCKISFDEWNVWTSLGQAYRADMPHYRIVEGIWAALVINTFIRHAEAVEMANFAQLVNTIGLIITYDDKIVLTPQYHAMKMYSDALGELALPTSVDCTETITTKAYSRDFPAATTPVLDAAATISKDGKKISVFVVNKHFKEPKQIEIMLASGQAISLDGKAAITLLHHDDPFACNTRDEPARISLQCSEMAVESGKISIDMPPHAAASIQFQVRGGI
nr:alpha-L-arabinofuranosidase C-terminal domain-containing protein [Candidatus Sigynarchaeum springense]